MGKRQTRGINPLCDAPPQAVAAPLVHAHVIAMTDDQDIREHANLETQRTRSNVYAFRKVKWGDPRQAFKGSRGMARLPGKRSGFPGFWTFLIFGALAAMAIALLVL
ncbi:hypothetical protein ASG47_09050 [Devosia sp. Leaf420]|nr:hypothetical protein ASG47_09050 [Devosia sp. Leaf420]